VKVVFLDRDGVINVDSPDYIKSWDEFDFIPGSLEAIALLTAHGLTVIVITNQSVIGRKLVEPETLQDMHQRVQDAVLAAGGRIHAFYHCPHVPQDACVCRKPEPGLILAAQRDFGLDLSQTCMVGDSEKDMVAAQKAGCGGRVLVRTGNGLKTESQLLQSGTSVDHVAENLLEAAKFIISFKGR